MNTTYRNGCSDRHFSPTYTSTSTCSTYPMFLGGIHPLTTQPELQRAIGEIAQISNLFLMTDFEGYSKGYAFFQVSSLETAISLVQTPLFLGGRTLQFQQKDSLKESHKRRVFIGGLAYSATDQDLKHAF